MATEIRNTSTNETIELACTIDGIDILGDVLGNNGAPHDGETFALDANDIAWWGRWASREERIHDAYEAANEAERAACDRAAAERSDDLEAAQDAMEAALGI